MGASCIGIRYVGVSVDTLLYMGVMMEQIAKLLREAYKIIQEADTTSIDAYYLAVEEAQGFIAEALDLAEE